MKVHRYVILSLIDDSLLPSFINKLKNDLNNLTVLLNIVQGIWKAEDGTLKCQSGNVNNLEWINLQDHDATSIVRSFEECQDAKVCGISDRLHEIADTLPYAGALLDVFIQIPSDWLPSQESSLSLCGSLRRLKDWHNASVTFISATETGSRNLQDHINEGTRKVDETQEEDVHSFLKSVISGTVVENVENVTFPENLSWRGKLAIVDKTANSSRLVTKIRWIVESVNGRVKQWKYFQNVVPNTQIPYIRDYICLVAALCNKYRQPLNAGNLENDQILAAKMKVNRGFILPGFTLKYAGTNMDPLSLVRKDEDQAVVLGRMLEVVDEVVLSTVPHYFFTTGKYSLSLYDSHPHSGAVMEHLSGNETSGMLVRLACYPHCQALPTCGEKYLSTSSWKESVVADITYVQEPEEECFHPHEYLYFIITKDRNKPISADSQADNLVCAYLIKSPSQIRGHLIGHLQHCFFTGKQLDSCVDSVDSLFSGLPHFDDNSMLWLDNNLSTIQARVLDKWIEENHPERNNIPLSSLFRILSQVQNEFLEEVRKSLPVYSGISSELDLSIFHTEIEQNPSEWPERKYLQHQECQKKTLQRLQSTDSVILSSPLQPDNDTPCTLDIKNFLKLFQADGKAACTSLSPVRQHHPSRSQNKFCSDATNEPASLPWPDCQDLRYPDIYYNRDKKSERVEMQCNKIRDRYVVEDTYSSCSSPLFVIAKETKKKSNESKRQDSDIMLNHLRRSPRKSVRKLSGLSHLKSPPGKNSLKSPRKTIVSQLLKSPRRLQSHHLKTSLTKETSVPKSSDVSDKCAITSPRRTPRKKVSKDLSRTLASDENRRLSLSSLNQREITQTSQPSRRNSIAAVNEKSVSVDKNQRDSSLKRRESRSERHKRRLEEIVKDVLKQNGVEPSNEIYQPCVQRLFKVTKLFVMDLPTSQNLKEEMRNIAEGQVKQVVDLERKRTGGTENYKKQRKT